MTSNSFKNMKEPLWNPSEERIKNANMTLFIEFINQRYRQQFDTYNQLYKWSVEKIPDFWECIWEYVDIWASSDYKTIVDDLGRMPGAKMV